MVFDPATVVARATYEKPLLEPVAVRAVLVSGRPAIRDGALNAHAGQNRAGLEA